MSEQTELDTLLSQPLGEIADSGFSAKVTAQIVALRMRRARHEAIALFVALGAVLAVLPFTDLGRAIERMSDTIPVSPTFIAALAALAISALLIDFVQGWQSQ